MADAGISASRILLVLEVGGLILIRSRLGVLRGSSVVQVMLVLLDNGRMTITAHRLHGSRNSQHVSAEQRQPNGQKHCNKFSERMTHVCRMANFISFVKLLQQTGCNQKCWQFRW